MSNGGQVRKISLLTIIILVIQCFDTTPLATAANCDWPCFMGDIDHNTNIAQPEYQLKNLPSTALISCDDIFTFDVSQTNVHILVGQRIRIVTSIILKDSKITRDYNLLINSNCDNISISIDKSDITITGNSYCKCQLSIWPDGCKTCSRFIDVFIEGPPCISIPDKKVSGIVNIAQASTTIGNFSVQNCSGSAAGVEVTSDDGNHIEVQSSGSSESSHNYAAVVSNWLLAPDKLYSGKLTAKSGNITKQLPYYYYTFNSSLQQIRPANCTGWTGMGGNASRANSVPQNDAPGSFNPSLIWSGLSYELDPNSTSPAIWNNRLIKLYVDGEKRGVECYDLSNKNLLWKTDDMAYGSEKFRGPSIYKDYVFVTIGNMIVALDANTGETSWSWSETDESVSGNPVIANDRVFSGGDKLRCHDLATGNVLWSKDSFGMYFSDLTIQSGILSVIARSLYIDDYTVIYVYECKSGKLLWSKKIDTPRLLSVFGPNAILLRYFDEYENRIDCYNPQTGALKWKYDIDGSTEWYANPAVFDIYCIILNGTTVRCIDTRTGRLIWQKTSSTQITNVPVIAGNRIYVVTANKGISTYDVKTGKLLANPFSSIPNDLYYWIDVIPAEGTFIVTYSNDYNINTLCCYANNGRFKKMKVTALEMSVNSKIITHNNYNTKKDYTILVAPQIINGVVCIPVKSVIDLFGGKYEITKDKTHKITFGSKTIELKPDSPTITINGKKTQINPKNLKITPKLVSNVLLVPSSFTGQTLGLTTHWDNQTKTVIYVYKLIY